MVFSEDEKGYANHVCGIVHNGARFMPDLLDYLAEKHSSMVVKAGVIGHIGRNSDLETYLMEQYKEEVGHLYIKKFQTTKQLEKNWFEFLEKNLSN